MRYNPHHCLARFSGRGCSRFPPPFDMLGLPEGFPYYMEGRWQGWKQATAFDLGTVQVFDIVRCCIPYGSAEPSIRKCATAVGGPVANPPIGRAMAGSGYRKPYLVWGPSKCHVCCIPYGLALSCVRQARGRKRACYPRRLKRQLS